MFALGIPIQDCGKLSVFDSRNLKHGVTEKTEKRSNGTESNFVIHVCCKVTNGLGDVSDLCFLSASVFQIHLLRSDEGDFEGPAWFGESWSVPKTPRTLLQQRVIYLEVA